MKKTKSFPVAVALMGLGAATSFAEIKINDNLSTSGFLDMSVNGAAPSEGDATLNASFDQFELDFMYKFGEISARADVNATPSARAPGSPVGDTASLAPTSSVYLEQGFVNYAKGGFGITAGRFLSSSGFEAAEPTGMFQYSTSKTLVYGYYQNGLALSYSTPMFGLYGAVVSDLWNPQEFELLNSAGFEGQVTLTPVEGITAKVAYLYQIYDEGVSAGDESQSLLNAWAQYAKGPLTVAAEFNLLSDWAIPNTTTNDASGMGWLGMVNYKITDKIAATVRYSGIKFEDVDDPDTEVTFSPSYAISGNWLVLAEVKQELDKEITNYALESTFAF
jgi:hypothetical protein